MNINEEKLHQLVERVIADQGATFQAPLIIIGDRLGLYKAMASGGPATSEELAERTGMAERYIREWLRANAAGGYVTYDPGTDTYSLSPEQAFMLADEDSPAYAIGGYESALAAAQNTTRMMEAFRTGEGLGWHEHAEDLFCGVARFFRPAYLAELVQNWIPALDGMEARLKTGARVADVGCGFGESTIIMAEAYPNSTFVGYDFHDGSIKAATQRAVAAGVVERVRFEVATAKNYDSAPYDLVTMFDCLHDLGDPVGAARHVLNTLRSDGTFMIVEPAASDRIEENLTPLGRANYAASTLVCVPNSLSQEVGLALGAQAGEAKIRDVVMEAGFTRFRCVAATPFNKVFEARP